MHLHVDHKHGRLGVYFGLLCKDYSSNEVMFVYDLLFQQDDIVGLK